MTQIAEKIKPEMSALWTLIEKSPSSVEFDALVEGPVIEVKRSAVYVDLAPFGTGIIFGREFLAAKDIIKKIKVGDIVKAKVVETENEDGYIELSLKEAKQALVWNEAEEAIKGKGIHDLQVKEANKG
ncbi:MAG: 30S ribosomal protein S1, partial [Candidatus Nomurabacteria bacterium GW2011_GWB1_37_5]